MEKAKQEWIWLDGNWLPQAQAVVPLGTHTLHYGLGCFEGIRSYLGAQAAAVFRLDDHLQRLQDSARLLGIELPFTVRTLRQACLDSLVRNQLQEAYIRPLVFLGDERLGMDPAGLSVHVAILARRWGRYLGEQALERGVRVKISSWSRHHPNVMPCRAKSIGAYTNAILAAREARRDGYDEAILLDTQGFVAEGPGENIFVLRHGQLWEPEITVALDGITRRSVHWLAAQLELPVRSARLTRDDLLLADEVFFAGTAVELTPVVAIDGQRIGSGSPGPLTRRLQAAYFAMVRGESTSPAGWLSTVAGAACQT